MITAATTGTASIAAPAIPAGYEVVTVTVKAGSFRDSATCPPGAIVVGHHPVGEVDQEIEAIRISAGMLKVKLAGKGKHDNMFNVVLLMQGDEPEAPEDPVTDTSETE